MVSSKKSLSQALMIVSNNPLEITISGFILCDMLVSCPYNHLTLRCQYPVAQFSDYYMRHTKPSAYPWASLQLLLVQILEKVIVAKIGPFTDVNSVTSYAFYPCGTAFVQVLRVNLIFS